MPTRITPEQAADHLMIQDTVNAYSHAIDDKDVALFLDCFTEDAAWVYKAEAHHADWAFRVEGRAALEAWYHGHHRMFPLGRENHMTIHTRIDLAGDSATAVSFFFVIRDVRSGLRVNTTGRYHDTLVRCDDGHWRIKERQGIGQMPNSAFQALRKAWVGDELGNT